MTPEVGAVSQRFVVEFENDVVEGEGGCEGCARCGFEIGEVKNVFRAGVGVVNVDFFTGADHSVAFDTADFSFFHGDGLGSVPGDSGADFGNSYQHVFFQVGTTTDYLEGLITDISCGDG